MIEVQTNIDYLIPYLRMHLGDLNPATYRYLDAWLRTALITSVKTLSRFWDSKYLVSDDVDLLDQATYSGIYDAVSRNELFRYFEFESPPDIQFKDERPIILMAAILVKSGQLENASWDFGSWRDAEQSFSNIESSRAKDESIRRDIQELYSVLKSPLKRLFITTRNDFVSQDM